MYADEKKVSAGTPKRNRGQAWRCQSNTNQAPGIHKQFVECICPKCTMVHQVYMLWTGRGAPRKYCGNCKPLVAGYDSSTHFEAAVLLPGHSKKRARCHKYE